MDGRFYYAPVSPRLGRPTSSPARTRACVAHIHAQLATTLEQHIVQSFPELGHGPESATRVRFVLRGLGLAAPFSPPTP